MARRKPNERPRRASDRTTAPRPVERTTTALPQEPRHVRVGRAKRLVRETTPRVNDNVHRASRKAALPKAVAPDAALKTPGHLFSQPSTKSEATTGPGAARPERADTPLDQRKCKAKPASNKGTGKGRSFVPWCK